MGFEVIVNYGAPDVGRKARTDRSAFKTLVLVPSLLMIAVVMIAEAIAMLALEKLPIAIPTWIEPIVDGTFVAIVVSTMVWLLLPFLSKGSITIGHAVRSSIAVSMGITILATETICHPIAAHLAIGMPYWVDASINLVILGLVATPPLSWAIWLLGSKSQSPWMPNSLKVAPHIMPRIAMLLMLAFIAFILLGLLANQAWRGQAAEENLSLINTLDRQRTLTLTLARLVETARTAPRPDVGLLKSTSAEIRAQGQAMDSLYTWPLPGKGTRSTLLDARMHHIVSLRNDFLAQADAVLEKFSAPSPGDNTRLLSTFGETNDFYGIVLEMIRSDMQEKIKLISRENDISLVLQGLAIAVLLILMAAGVVGPVSQMIKVQHAAALFALRDLTAANTMAEKAIESSEALSKKLERESKMSQAVLDTAVDGIMLIDAKGTIRNFNKSCERIFDFKEHEVLGKNVSMLMPIDHAQGHDEHFARAGRGDRPIIGSIRELPAIRKGGTEFPMELAVGEIRDNGEILYTGMIRDISARKHAENQLILAKNKAENALEELHLAQEGLVRSQKLASLGGLVAGVAHEVNTPLGIALTSASHLAAETARLRRLYDKEELTAELLEEFVGGATDAATLIERSCTRAAELIQGFKLVAVDQTSGEMRTFDLQEYLEEVLASIGPALRKHPIDVRLDCPTGVIMNSFPGSLSQIVTNLVMNAAIHAFHVAPGEIMDANGKKQDRGRIDIAAAESGQNDICLTVTDNGKGIPPEVIARIFDPFFTTRRNAGGSGLGLSIVVNLASSIGGNVFVDSIPGQTKFTVTFPRRMTTADSKDAAS
jgi:PAS domain S-box-containing protein